MAQHLNIEPTTHRTYTHNRTHTLVASFVSAFNLLRILSEVTMPPTTTNTIATTSITRAPTTCSYNHTTSNNNQQQQPQQQHQEPQEQHQHYKTTTNNNYHYGKCFHQASVWSHKSCSRCPLPAATSQMEMHTLTCIYWHCTNNAKQVPS